MKHNQEDEDSAYAQLDRNLAFYDNILASNDYLVADQLTLADLYFFFSLYYPYKMYIGEERKSKFSNVTKFMDRLASDKRFVKVLNNAKKV
jgi:elongation factor 1-gamma